MRGIQNTPQEPKWALPGKWDWSVRLSLVSSVALCAGMLYGSSVGHQGARPRLESTSCLPDRHDVHRHAEHGQRRLGRQHAWQVGCAAGAGDDRPEAAGGC